MSRARLAGALLKGAYKALRSPAARKAAGKVFQLGNKTKGTASRAAVKAAVNSSPAAKRIGARAAAKAADKAATGRTSRVINRVRGTNPQPSKAALARANRAKAKSVEAVQFDRKGITDGQPWKPVTPNKGNGKATTTKGATTQVTPKPAPTTTRTKAQVRRDLTRSLRDQGPDHVEATLRGQNAAGQARGPIRPRSSGDRIGPGNAYTRNTPGGRQRSTTPAALTPSTPATGRVRENSRLAGREAVERFEGRANRIISDRLSTDEALQMSSAERSALRRQLQQQSRAGARRVREAAEAGSSRAQNTTRRGTASFEGTGRNSSQDLNRYDRNGSVSEAQARRRASRPRTTITDPSMGKPTPINTASPAKRPTETAASAMRRRQTAEATGRGTPTRTGDQGKGVPDNGILRSTTRKKPPAPPDVTKVNGKKVPTYGQTPVKLTGNVPQRTPNTQTPTELARQQRSDQALRNRVHNKGVDKHGTDLNKLMQDGMRFMTRIGRL